MSDFWSALSKCLESETGLRLVSGSEREQGGGCINAAWLVSAENLKGEKRSLFVKANRLEKLAMFETEAAALAEIAETNTIRVPCPVWCGEAGNRSALVLEAISMQRSPGARFEEEMGRQLARMHRVTESRGRFGWDRDNVIGETPQPNGWMDSWPAFFAKRRIGFQLELAADRGRNFRGSEALGEAIPKFFSHYNPAPSLLHGDLWGGNAAFDEGGNPVIFDPATYYGDREADLAFTELFGGFSSAFYRGYESEWPLDPGFAQRKTLYNLYHVLNHDHLFGGGYVVRAQGMIDTLLRPR
ncbi:MAG: fructosamine kinase family protein [Verrucomicrobiae bacterium]|nr:fructosamine kinase family protein [Verrucomicrobiae bacterium]